MSTHITRRVILEMLLLQQALNRGGIKQPIRFKASANDNYHYMLNQIITGKALAYSDSFWMADLKPEAHNFYVSPATIEYGQYIVGLYTSSTNKRALASNSAKLHTLSAVSNRAWSADWIALESLQLKELRHSRHWRLMASMVQKHDIDFLLNPFQGTADQTMSRGNFNLIPIPGLKLALYDSRHFAISRYHPQGQRMYQALKLGINKLKQDGTWIRAYREAGVIDPRVDQWTTVNPPIKSEKK